MKLTPAQAQKILTGNYTFSMLGFSMLITRLRGDYRKDSSPANLQKCLSEINAFIQKYSPAMSADIAVLSKI